MVADAVVGLPIAASILFSGTWEVVQLETCEWSLIVLAAARAFCAVVGPLIA